MHLVWVIDPVTKEEVTLTPSFPSLQAAFDYKELLSKKYPDLIFYHTTGIEVPDENRKPLRSVVGYV